MKPSPEIRFHERLYVSNSILSRFGTFGIPAAIASFLPVCVQRAWSRATCTTVQNQTFGGSVTSEPGNFEPRIHLTLHRGQASPRSAPPPPPRMHSPPAPARG